MAIAAPRTGKPLDERGVDTPPSQELALISRQKINGAEQVGVGVEQEELFQHPLGARVRDQPVVYEGNFHQAGRLAMRLSSERAARIHVY
jgi:hypothetical protein